MRLYAMYLPSKRVERIHTVEVMIAFGALVEENIEYEQIPENARPGFTGAYRVVENGPTVGYWHNRLHRLEERQKNLQTEIDEVRSQIEEGKGDGGV